MNKLSVADKLMTIANNTPLVCEKLYTKKTVSGNPVVAGDVSFAGDELEVKVKSKNLFDISKIRIVEYKCPRCGKEYLFKIDEMTWNDCGWFDCACGCRVTYEKI